MDTSVRILFPLFYLRKAVKYNELYGHSKRSIMYSTAKVEEKYRGKKGKDDVIGLQQGWRSHRGKREMNGRIDERKGEE